MSSKSTLTNGFLTTEPSNVKTSFRSRNLLIWNHKPFAMRHRSGLSKLPELDRHRARLLLKPCPGGRSITPDDMPL